MFTYRAVTASHRVLFSYYIYTTKSSTQLGKWKLITKPFFFSAHNWCYCLSPPYISHTDADLYNSALPMTIIIIKTR